MRFNNKMIPGMGGLAVLTAALVFHACRPQDFGSLGAAPKAGFTVVNKDANNIVLVNGSSPASIPYWSIAETNASYSGDSAKVYLGIAGTYHVKLLAMGHGGMDSIIKTVTIATNDPNLCAPGTMQGFLSGCSQKKWRLFQGAGALGVGPSEGDVSWWSNGAGDVTTGRPCTFNDEFTFILGLGNNFKYDGKSDYYTEDYMGPSNWSCADESTLTGAQKAWATNMTDFSYQLVSNAGTHPGLGVLQLNGTGAHIALPKVQNAGQITSGPASGTLRYNIIDTAHDASGNSVLTLSIYTNDNVWWRLKLSTN